MTGNPSLKIWIVKLIRVLKLGVKLENSLWYVVHNHGVVDIRVIELFKGIAEPSLLLKDGWEVGGLVLIGKKVR